MKKILLLSAIALMAATASAQDLPESIIPAGVTVWPTPNTTIDTSDNEYPLGMSSIGIDFGAEVMVNVNNTEPAVLYKDDFEAPLATTLRTSVDQMNHKTAGVLFTNKYTADGQYKLVIPEGMFLFEAEEADANGEPIGAGKTPGMTLYYNIFQGWTVLPNAGMVLPEIEQIVFTFPNATEVSVAENVSYTFNTMDGESASLVWTVSGNKVYGSFDQGGISYNFEQPGSWLLHIQPGQFTFVVNGKTLTNTEIRINYTIPQTPEPAIWPYCDEVVTTGFEYFELEVPAGWDTEDFWFSKDDMAQNPIYMVDDYGNVDFSTKIAVAKVINAESTGNLIYLGLFDATTYEPLNFEWDKSAGEWASYAWTCKNVTPWIPEQSGKYALQLSKGLYSGNYTSPIVRPGQTNSAEYLNSDPYIFIYDVVGLTSGVEEVAVVAPVAETFDIYNVSGVCVARKATKATLNTLPAGLYIAGGKKVLVK